MHDKKCEDDDDDDDDDDHDGDGGDDDDDGDALDIHSRFPGERWICFQVLSYARPIV